MARFLFFAATVLLCACPSAPGVVEPIDLRSVPAYDAAFWQHWGDGKAEVDGYALTVQRYGEQRTGSAVLIFVTEPWSKAASVKADPGKHPADDVIQVLKLNAISRFQTGIYDYNLMTSAWTALMAAPGTPVGGPAKLAFSAAEWCGTTWAEVVFEARHATELVRSYFDGESGTRKLENPAAGGQIGLVEDLVLVWARGLASPIVGPGETREVRFLPSLSRARLEHTPLSWTTAKLERHAGDVEVTVPAGTFTAERVTVTVAEGRTIDVHVERKSPRRILQVRTSDGGHLALTGTVRTAYWEKNHEGDEAMLSAVGLNPAPPPPAPKP